jgi:hypothetical protein
MTGIENRNIRVGEIARLDVTVRRERFRHSFGIVDIHLAAEGLDEDLLWGRRRTHIFAARR